MTMTLVPNTAYQCGKYAPSPYSPSKSPSVLIAIVHRILNLSRPRIFPGTLHLPQSASRGGSIGHRRTTTTTSYWITMTTIGDHEEATSVKEGYCIVWGGAEKAGGRLGYVQDNGRVWAGGREQHRDPDVQRRCRLMRPFRCRWATRRRIKCTHKYGCSTSPTLAAIHPLLVQHRPLPCQPKHVRTPNWCTSHSFCGGSRIWGAFMCVRSPSLHPPSAPHITL
ncbi:hypothetical protein ARMSODRAFT_523447 [Armillaria solidipes]|uniref:Uncharacterized protein n=1 Tax=Armillaria solidipes TaxID=1076256 RepID=A0A2H3AYE8_9AGAR|nr:hypothetical protein ARMSODRAFT_523447 [Armillaria solidipes]